MKSMSANSARLCALATMCASIHALGCGGGGGSAGGGGGGGGASAPDGTQTAQVAFGSHPQAYQGGVLRPSGAQAALDDVIRQKYKAWKANFLIKGCGGYYVCANEVTGRCVNDGAALVPTGGKGADGLPLDMELIVSEGHGYGMLLAALMAGEDPEARDIFDGMVAVRDHFTSPYDVHLMTWKILAGCAPPDAADNDAATDGDLDSAFAFLLAAKQWQSPSYRQRGLDLIDAILNREMNVQTHLPLLGDWANPSDDQKSYYSTRLSDDMPDHFRVFATATGRADWNASVTAVYALMNRMQTMFSPMTGLVPDFVKGTDGDSTPVAVSEADMLLMEQLTTDYDYNACRVPWRLGTDLAVNGEPAATTVLGKLNTFIKTKTGGDPAKILDGYSLAGDAHTNAGPNGCFTGGFGVAAMSDPGSQAWLDAIWNQLANQKESDGYFGDTVSLLAMIVMSGNWWAP